MSLMYEPFLPTMNVSLDEVAVMPLSPTAVNTYFTLFALGVARNWLIVYAPSTVTAIVSASLTCVSKCATSAVPGIVSELQFAAVPQLVSAPPASQ